LNSGFEASKQTLFEPHLQSILLWLFWRSGLENYLPGWAQTIILLISASEVARIKAMSYTLAFFVKLLR
jgi:hypothetical protein